MTLNNLLFVRVYNESLTVQFKVTDASSNCGNMYTHTLALHKYSLHGITYQCLQLKTRKQITQRWT